MAGVGGLLAIAPELFSLPAGRTDLSRLLIHAPNFAALYVTVGILAARYAAPASEIERRETRIVLVALSLYAAYTAGFYLTLYGRLTFFGEGTRTWGTATLFAVFLVATGYLLRQFVRGSTKHRSKAAGPGGNRLVAAATVVPLCLGLLSSIGESLNVAQVHLFGPLRIASAVLIVYGLLKFELFGIDLTIKKGVKRSAIVGIFLLVFFVVSEGIEMVVSGNLGTWAGLGAAGALTLGLRPLERGAERLADQVLPGVEASDDYLSQRRLEVYEAAVERAVRDLVLDEREQDVLDRLAADLGIQAREAQAIQTRIFQAAPGNVATA